MRRAKAFVQDQYTGILEETDDKKYRFIYEAHYQGPPVSLTLPIQNRIYHFDEFPPFFEGLLPEGPQLEALLRREKIDRKDYFKQLVTVGADLIGDVTVEEILLQEKP